MVKTLARSIREFKKPALLTPMLVTVEVILECIIPFNSEIARTRCRRDAAWTSSSAMACSCW